MEEATATLLTPAASEGTSSSTRAQRARAKQPQRARAKQPQRAQAKQPQRGAGLEPASSPGGETNTEKTAATSTLGFLPRLYQPHRAGFGHKAPQRHRPSSEEEPGFLDASRLEKVCTVTPQTEATRCPRTQCWSLPAWEPARWGEATARTTRDNVYSKTR